MLRARGAVVEECSLPLLDYAVPAYYILACAEASSNLARFDGVKYGWRAAAAVWRSCTAEPAPRASARR